MALAQLEYEYQQLERRTSQFTTQTEPVNFSGRIDVVDSDEHDSIEFGGMLDPITRMYTELAPEPAVVWEVGREQLPALQFYQTQGKPVFVCVGAMGAGKSEILARAAVMFGSEFRNADIGIVAPTRQKLGTVWKKMVRVIPSGWIAEMRKRPVDEPPFIMLMNGVRFQFLSAKAPSKAMGTQIHGQDWVGAFVDEEEQVTDEAMADVVSRGRDAPDGWFPILTTCTISDSPEFRARLAKNKVDPGVIVHRMQITANPWVHPKFIEQLRSALTSRQFNMRVLALEEPPERATYYDYSTALHVRKLPQLGVYDVTERIIGAGKHMLLGYDPGKLCDFHVALKAFLVGDNKEPWWWVMGQCVTRPGNPHKHAANVERWLKSQFRLTPKDTVTRSDPHSRSDSGTSVDVYRELQAKGFDVRPAVYKKRKDATRPSAPGVLQKDARIMVVTTLLLNSNDETRLYINANDNGAPCAPDVATSLEMSERDEMGRAEMYKKGVESDLSHPTCGLGYALYPYEHKRVAVGLRAMGS